MIIYPWVSILAPSDYHNIFSQEAGMTELLLNDDVQSMSVDDLSDFLESKGIDAEDTIELASKLVAYRLHLAIMCGAHYLEKPCSRYHGN